MNKIFVIGETTINSREIEYAAKALKTVGNNFVEYEKPMDMLYTLEDTIETVFNNIEWCDQLYIVGCKGSINESSALCKIEYARRLKKEIIYLN